MEKKFFYQTVKCRIHHLLFTLLAFVIAFVFAACGNKELRKMVKEIGNECPLSLGNGITFEKVTYSRNTVTFTYDIDILDIAAISKNDSAFRSNMLSGYAYNQDDSFRLLMEAIINSKADLKVVFRNEKGESYDMHFNAAELAENMPGSAGVDPEKSFMNMLDNFMMQIPVDMGNGMVMQDLTIDENSLTYQYDCDESLIDLDEMLGKEPEMKKMVFGEFYSNILARKLSDLLKATNRTLVYKYVGTSSGKTVTVSLAPDELP